ncbi:MAG: IMP cyclohydrolase [Clostridiales bacterium]|nr:IMP cyclohydrolase [Clostridiales bacterium]
MLQLAEELQQNSYPGRGIVLGKSADGNQMVIAYFIMGRSENSRNRVFVEENGGIKTQAFDPSKLTDPSLIIYSPVRVINGKTIVTNGDQTDTIYDFIAKGDTFENALQTRTFEPDAPNFTPRISGIIDGDRYTLSILKSANGNPDSTCRYFFDYQSPLAGEGHFIHTYRCDGNPIPSFEGEPKKIAVNGDIDAFTESVWNSLNADNKVSLFTRYIDLTTGETQTRICNKNQ